MRIDRLIGITMYLLNRNVVSARELADKFEVSVRTIVRDVEALNSSELNKLVDRVYSQLEARLARERRRYGY